MSALIAHRGASALAPENTMEAFEKAFRMGAHWIELDVQMALCGTLVVAHDRSLKRVAGLPHRIEDLPYRVLKNVDAGSWFSAAYADARIPTLKQVLDACARWGVGVNIELKPARGRRLLFCQALVRVLASLPDEAQQRLLVSSSSYATLMRFHALAPAVPLAWIAQDRQRRQFRARMQDVRLCAWVLNLRQCTPRRVKALKEAGKAVWCYTVNKQDVAEALLARGVDAVFSDHPTLLRDALMPLE